LLAVINFGFDDKVLWVTAFSSLTRVERHRIFLRALLTLKPDLQELNRVILENNQNLAQNLLNLMIFSLLRVDMIQMIIFLRQIQCRDAQILKFLWFTFRSIKGAADFKQLA